MANGRSERGRSPALPLLLARGDSHGLVNVREDAGSGLVLGHENVVGQDDLAHTVAGLRKILHNHVVDEREFPIVPIEDIAVVLALEAVGDDFKRAKQCCYRAALYPRF